MRGRSISRAIGSIRATSWVRACCLAALLGLGTAPARAGTPAPLDDPRSTMRWAGGGLPAVLSHPEAAGPARPAVILLGDGPAADGRNAFYARRLLGLGIAVLEIDFADNQADESGPSAMPLHRRLDLAVATLVAEPGIDSQRIGLIGLGEGARAAMLGHASAARLAAAVLLYPGCDAPLGAAVRDGAPAMAAVEVLLMHGDADPANEAAACGGLATALAAAGARVAHVVMRDASYAWDLPRNGAPGMATLLPDPTGAAGRIRAEADPVMAAIGADRALSTLLPALLDPRPDALRRVAVQEPSR